MLQPIKKDALMRSNTGSINIGEQPGRIIIAQSELNRDRKGIMKS
jgi:hypothetical protein